MMIQVLLKGFSPFLVHRTLPLAVIEQTLLPGTVEAKAFELS